MIARQNQILFLFILFASFGSFFESYAEPFYCKGAVKLSRQAKQAQVGGEFDRWGTGNHTTLTYSFLKQGLLFAVNDDGISEALKLGLVASNLRTAFSDHNILLSDTITIVTGLPEPNRWGIRDENSEREFTATKNGSTIDIKNAADETLVGSPSKIWVEPEPILDNSDQGRAPFPSNARVLVNNAFLIWSSFADLTFVEVDEASGAIGHIRIGAHTGFGSNVLGHALQPPIPASDEVNTGFDSTGDLHFNSENNNLGDERLFFLTAVHELGHALGLGHIVGENMHSLNPEEILMYPVIDKQQSPLTPFDIVYIQQLYGPPIPKILNGDLDDRVIRWMYPHLPFTTGEIMPDAIDPENSSNPRVPAYTVGEADFHRCTGANDTICDPAPPDPHLNIDDRDVAIAKFNERLLTTFELQRQEFEVKTLTDGAEDEEPRLFDETVFDVQGGDTNWDRIDILKVEGKEDVVIPCTPLQHGVDCRLKSYLIHDTQFSLIKTYPLPLITSVEGTSTSKLRFMRAYFLAEDQFIHYKVITDDDGMEQTLQSEFGHNTSIGEAKKDYELKEFDLSNLAGKSFRINFEFEQKVFTHEDASEVRIDNIELVDILSPAGEFVSISNSIMPEVSNMILGALPSGAYRFRLRANYNDVPQEQLVFSKEVRRNFDKAVTINPIASNDSTPELSGFISDPGATSITVLVNGKTYPANNNTDGTWTLPDNMIDPPLPDNVYDVKVTAVLSTLTICDETVDELIVDTTPPVIEAGILSGDNSYVEIRFSDGIFGGSGSPTPVKDTDFQVNVSNDPGITVSISNVLTPGGGNLLGGESIIRINLNITGQPSGSEILNIELVNTLFNRVGDPIVGGPGSIATLHLNGPVNFSITFFPEGGESSIALNFGRDFTATEGNDDVQDEKYLNPESAIFYFQNPTSGQNQVLEKLIQDFRPLSERTRWNLVLDAPRGELHWDVAGANPDYFFFLQQLDNETPLHSPIDLINTDSNVNPLLVSNPSSFEILYGPVQTIDELEIRKGWNLVSIPVISLQSAESIFGAIITEPIWFWNGCNFQILNKTNPLNPERGYWMNSQDGGISSLISGLLTDGLVNIHPNWNLVGPIADQISVPQSIPNVWEWDPDQMELRQPGNNGIRTSRGYWMFSGSNTSIELGN